MNWQQVADIAVGVALVVLAVAIVVDRLARLVGGRFVSAELMRGGRVRAYATDAGCVALDGTDPATLNRFFLDLTPLEAIGLAEQLRKAAGLDGAS